MASEPAPKPESPRRRSTVREPAPFVIGGAAPAPQSAPAAITSVDEVEPTAPAAITSVAEAEPAAPAAVTSAAEVEPTASPSPAQPPAETVEPAAPRRAGWWAKRMLGEKR